MGWERCVCTSVQVALACAGTQLFPRLTRSPVAFFLFHILNKATEVQLSESRSEQQFLRSQRDRWVRPQSEKQKWPPEPNSRTDKSSSFQPSAPSHVVPSQVETLRRDEGDEHQEQKIRPETKGAGRYPIHPRASRRPAQRPATGHRRCWQLEEVHFSFLSAG